VADRIERWYRARGYYDAHVERATFDPASAGESDELPPAGEAPCDRRRDNQGCRLEIDVYVREGEPVRVQEVEVAGHESLGRNTRRNVLDAVALHSGDRFDEALHDRTKVRMVTAMREAGYACADVRGQVDLDPDQRLANVHYAVSPGIVSHFHEVRVEVQGDAHGIPLDVVKAVSGLEAGMRYAPSHITSAQRDVYALGSFSSVEVEAVPVRADGSEAASASTCTGDVDVVIHVTPGRRIRYGLGAGLDSGMVSYLASGNAVQSVPQWNVHLVARFEHRNLLGGLRRLRIEDRPKLVFQSSFPGVNRRNDSTPGTDPTLGNELMFEFRQPAFIERATTLTVAGRWDLGPDPIYGGLRHLVDVGTYVQRSFFQSHLLVQVGVFGNAYKVVPGHTDIDPADYAMSFFRQLIQLDFRDDPHVTRRGFMISLDVNEAGTAGLSTWSYFRFIPEVRAFIPLPARFTIAGRFLMGVTTIYNRPDGDFFDKDPRSWWLGPSAYRLRGGGPNSHRGFVSGSLGDPTNDNDYYGFRAIDGGLTKWEASLEIRSQITESLAAVVFADAGDVNRSWNVSDTSVSGAPLRFRFNVPHLAFGFGLRYYTIVGPLRIDFGFRPRNLNSFGLSREEDEALWGRHSILLNSRVSGAVSLTIGEAF